MDQERLNQEMLDLGVSRYRKTSSTAHGSLTHAGRRIMRDAVDPMWRALLESLEKIREIRNKTKWQRLLVEIKDNDLKAVAFLGVKTALDSLNSPRSFSSTAFRIGRAVEDQLLSDHLIRTHEFGGRLVHRMQNVRAGDVASRYLHKTARNEEAGWDDWARRDKLGCGAMILELIQAYTGLIKYTEKAHRKRKHFKPQRMVEISDMTREWINEYDNYREVLLPFWMPMVESPEPWDGVYGGGYGMQSALPVLPFIRCSERKLLREAPDMPEVYNAVNLIQETPYTINNKVLDVLEWAWDNDLRIGLPPREDIPLPDWVGDDATTEEKRNHRDNKRELAQYNLSLESKRILIGRILMLARKYKDKRMFMPSSCDFRGRIYQIPAFLNYQGPDHCRGLLKFHRGLKIKSEDDLKWLGIHGANCFGYDKTTFEDRRSWADDFTSNAIQIARDPRSNREWQDADDPWQFLAWCFEWSEFHTRRSSNFETHLPCAMDATNSGLQLLSLLARDPDGCFATNVAPTDKPEDIYKMVADYTYLKICRDAKDGKNFSRIWKDFGLTRKMAKRPVMCYSYGLTPYSNRDYVKQWYFETLEDEARPCVFGRDYKYPAIKYLADHLWDSIEELLTKPKKVMDWLQEVATLKAKDNGPLEWTTPSGFKVTQDYRKQVSRKVSTWLHGSLTAVRFKDTTDEIDSRRQANGAAPNVIHSLDASGLVLTVNEAHRRGIYDFAMIHDSFATHSNNCDLLSASIRDVFCDMFSNDLLADLKAQWESDGLELPPLPDYGDFDVNTLRDSKYFFS